MLSGSAATGNAGTVDTVDQLLSFDHTSVRSLQTFTGRVVQHLATVAPAAARCYLRPLYDAVAGANAALAVGTCVTVALSEYGYTVQA